MLRDTQQLLLQLQSLGYPAALDNVRIKPYSLYDEVTIATGTQQYYAFVNSSISTFVRNRKLPLSANEVVMVDKIRVMLFDNIPLQSDILTRAYISIKVDDRDKIKIPFADVLTFGIINQPDAAALNTNLALPSVIDRSRPLLFPIIINSSANIEVKIEMDTAIATALNTKVLRVELDGVKFDKIKENFTYNPQATGGIERLSYVMYDTQTMLASSAARSYNLFADANKSPWDYSKIFPLGDRETFSIENIEFMTFQSNVSSADDQSILGNLKRAVLNLKIGDTDYFVSAQPEMFTLFAAGISGTVYNSRYYSTKGYILPTPITVPAKALVKATLELPVNLLQGTPYLCAMFKGTLQRMAA